MRKRVDGGLASFAEASPAPAYDGLTSRFDRQFATRRVAVEGPGSAYGAGIQLRAERSLRRKRAATSRKTLAARTGSPARIFAKSF
jgi:hypothetical protein